MMQESQERPHPDDFMDVYVQIDFRAKEAPGANHPVKPASVAFTLPAKEAVEDLEKIIEAIEDQRLYGWVCQQCAEHPVACGQWVGKSLQDEIDEMKPNGDRK